MITIHLVNDHEFILENTDDCHNAGPACYGCPVFDQCTNHEDLTEN